MEYILSGDDFKKMRKICFGTDGIRAEVGTELTPKIAFSIGASLREIYGKRLRIAVGMDTRISSPMLSAALISGLLSSGCEAHILGVMPTPAVAYLIDKLSLDLGIVITASHNPFRDNGIKIIGRCAEKCSPAVERKIEEYIIGVRLPRFVSGAEVGRAYMREGEARSYLGFLGERFSGVGRGLVVGLDAANGAGYSLSAKALELSGCRLVTVGNTPDGININDKNGSLYPDAIARVTKERGLDIGIALDGDGDRCIAVDERGRVVDGDGILYILSMYKRDRGVLRNNRIAATVTSNAALAAALKKEGIDVSVTSVGDRAVADRMREADISLGGESSGHIIDSDILPTGDGTATALSLLKVMSETGKSLSSLLSGFEPYPSVSISVAVKNKENALASESVLEAKARAEAIVGDEGRVLLRASGTENKIRILAECLDKESCRMAAEIIEKAITRERG